MRTIRYTCVLLALTWLLCVASVAEASFLTQGSGQWAKPGVPCMAYHDEHFESQRSDTGCYDNALNGDTGAYRITYLSGMTYRIECFSDSGRYSSFNVLWDSRAPFKYDQPGWGIMYLLP